MHKFSSQEIRKQNYIVLAIVALLVIVSLLVHEYFNYSLKPVSTEDSRIVKVTIPQNSTDQQVSRIVKKHQLVRSRYVFYYYLQTHKTHGVKAGTFNLRKTQSIPEMVTHLQESKRAKK